jgi:hypothetical protein
MSDPILKNLTSPPNAGKNELYRWCDYIELRCLAHTDHRFSRDALAESIDENVATPIEEFADGDSCDIDIDPVSNDVVHRRTERNEQHAADCFKHLRWRASAFGDNWPFQLDEHAIEISLKDTLSDIQRFYLSLLLSSSLRYCPKGRWRVLTGLFEQVSHSIMVNLMPRGSEVHAFGAASSTHYTGHLYDKLTKLASDLHGKLALEKRHFSTHDSGDGGLDLVAWHNLGDERPGIPASLAQCGCTADGWPNKMLQASPARLSGHLNVLNDWETFYFMPLDLSTEYDGKMEWQCFSDFSKVIVIDRLRFIRLITSYALPAAAMTARNEVDEALTLRVA